MTTSSYSDEAVAGGDDLATARKRLTIAIEATNENRVFQLNDLKFAAGSPDNKFQWPDSIVRMREQDPNGSRVCLTINKLPQHINQVTNEQRQNKPSIKIIPVDDKGDKEVAEVLTGIIRHIEYQSDADVAYAVAGENQVTIGEGYLRVLSDYVDEQSFDQDLRIVGIKNSFSVYMDPVALQKDPTGGACEWAFIVEDLTKDDFERQYPKADPINWDVVGRGDEFKSWFPDSNTVRIAEYFCFDYEQKTICLWADGNVTIKGDEEASRPYIGQKPIKERQTTIKKLMWSKMNGCEVLDEREMPGRYIPIVRMVGNEWYIDGRMVVAGLIRNAKDAQRMFNYWKSTECETLALAPKAPYVGAAEAFEGFEEDWKQANLKNLSYLKYNLFAEGMEGQIPKPERSQPPLPPVGIVNAALGAADDIKAATGQYDPSLGNNPQAKSGIALQREQRKTDTGTYHYIDNQARAVRQVGRILIDILPKYYDTKRIARIIGEDGDTDHVMIDPDQQQAIMNPEDDVTGAIQTITINPSIGKYDVIVSVGPSFTSKRQEAADLMGQVLQGQPQLMSIIGDLYFRQLDVPGAEEIAERLKKTLPPGLADDPDDKDAEPVIQTPQGPMPASAASQMMLQMAQELQQAGEQLKAAGDIQAEGQQVQQEKNAVELAKKDLEKMLAELSSEQEQLALREQLFEATQKQAHLEAQSSLRDERDAMRDEHAKVKEEVNRQVAESSKESEAKPQSQPMNVIDSAAAGPLSDIAQSNVVIAQAVSQNSEAIMSLAKAVAAPRRHRMNIDGETLESTSEAVQ